MKKMILALTICAFAAIPMGLSVAHADNGVAGDVKEGAQDAGKAVRKGARKVKDKTCELVNGKMECAGKKVKHKLQNASDDVKDAVK